MMQRPADHDEVRFAPLIGANQSLSCQLLVVGGGLFGLSAAQAAVLRDIDVGRVWTKATSAVNGPVLVRLGKAARCDGG